MTGANGIPRLMLVALCCLAIAIPFLVVQYPPITDLPQQTAQIRLFLDTFGHQDTSEYKIQWLTPYSLSYLLLGLSWAVFGPENAGRVAMLAVGLLWVLAIHAVFFRRGRSGAAAALASVFVFNHILYWGFYSFAIGWPAFLLWFSVTTRQIPRFSLAEALTLIAAALLLYLSHVLWFMAGICWLVLYSLVFDRSIRRFFARSVCLLPLAAAVAAWYPMFSESSMATPPLWATDPWARLSFTWLTDAALGGMYGPAEYVVCAVCAGWTVLAIFQNRKDLGSDCDGPFLLVSLMFFAFVVFLPDKFMNTIRFSQRWMPMTMIALLAALPAPALRPILRQTAAVVILSAFCLVTASVWHGFQDKELSGLKGSLKELPQAPKLLGLSFIQHSEFVRGRPFIQVFAYAQVLKGGMLNFSFAEFSPCLVVYKKTFVSPWTNGLEWFPARTTEADLEYFDFVLVNGTEEIHRNIRSISRLAPVGRDGRWRLYRVEHGTLK
ncbi:MAG TPA: hypothetical protein VK463_11180 [Desulfomonilaceae bacterium]|nr:hypothetical protein [Desulfomonilaceae bacterium]